jgi:hypothetical protein
MAAELQVIEIAITSTAKMISKLGLTANNINLADSMPNSQPDEPSVLIVKASSRIVRADSKPQQECFGFSPPDTLVPSDNEDEITPIPSPLAKLMRSSSPPQPAHTVTPAVIIREQTDKGPVKSKTKHTSILESTLRQSKNSRKMLHAIKAKISNDPEARFSHSGPIPIPARQKTNESNEKCFLTSRSDSPSLTMNIYHSDASYSPNFK